jgi:hypothetical protein
VRDFITGRQARCAPAVDQGESLENLGARDRQRAAAGRGVGIHAIGELQRRFVLDEVSNCSTAAPPASSFSVTSTGRTTS